MAPTPPAFRALKTSATGKKPTTNKHKAFISRYESLSKPFTSKTGTDVVSMKLNHASETQITNTIPTKNVDPVIIKKDFIARCDKPSQESILQSTTRDGSPFLEVLNSDVRYSIYDALVDTEHEVIINPTSKYRGPISALSIACHQTNNELKIWVTARKHLTFNPTFGLLNLSRTTFRISWSRVDNYSKKLEKFQRCYTPEAAGMHLYQLELWQRAMSISKSCTQVDINDQVCKNPSLQAIGPIPKMRGTLEIRQGIRALSLNNHNSNCTHDAKDFIVLDPKIFKGETETPACNKLGYFGNPYVWSRDWKDHEVKQEYAFRHPEEGGVWAKGLEAAGWAPIQAGWGWEKTFGYMRAFRIIEEEQCDGTARKMILHEWIKVRHKGEGWRDTEKMLTGVCLRGGLGMDVDPDTYDSNMEIDQHAKDKDEDEGMDSENGCEEEMVSDNIVVLGPNEREDADVREEGVNMDDPHTTTVVTLSEATARRAINRSVALIDED